MVIILIRYFKDLIVSCAIALAFLSIISGNTSAQSSLSMFEEDPISAAIPQSEGHVITPLDDVVSTWLSDDLTKKKIELKTWRKQETSYCTSPPSPRGPVFQFRASFSCDDEKDQRGYSCWLQNQQFDERMEANEKRRARISRAKFAALKRKWKARCQNFDPMTSAPNPNLTSEIQSIEADLAHELEFQKDVSSDGTTRMRSKQIAQGNAAIADNMIRDQELAALQAQKQQKRDSLDRKLQEEVAARKEEHIRWCTERYRSTGYVGCSCYDIFPQARPTSIFDEAGGAVCEE